MAIVNSTDVVLDRTINLAGSKGNAFYLLGLADSLSKQLKFDGEKRCRIQEEMTSGDYENLIVTFDMYFGSIYTLVRAS